MLMRLRRAAVATLMSLIALNYAFAEVRAGGASEPRLLRASNSIEERLRTLSLDEKIDLLGGSGFGTTAIPRANIPVFHMSDGPAGVRSPSPSTAFAGGIGLAATWDPALARETGVQMGRDARARGIKFLLAPAVNIYRSPLNGRNFEYYGEDPLLGARIAVELINGIQTQNVSATIKHFAANNSEFARHTSDSVVDERTLREIYLPIFESAVREARTGAVMSSYNLLNGLRTSAHPALIGILKREWAFDGVYMSDWAATYDGAAAARAGLDLEMPTGAFMNRDNLKRALRDGSISEADIDDKVRRLLQLAERFGWFNHSERDLAIPTYNQAGRDVALRGARESIVLLKNRDQLLPLDPARMRRIAVIGPNAHPAVVTGGGSGRARGFSQVSVLQGISDRLGARGQVTYASGIRSLRSLALTTPFMVDGSAQKRGVQVEVFKDATFSGPAIAQRFEPRFETGVAGFGTELFDAIDELPREEVLAQLREAFSKSSTFERWSASLTPQSSGSHSVFVQSMVRYRLLVDGKVVIDSSKIPIAALRQQRLQLDAGPHSVVFEQLATQEIGRPFWRVGIVHDDSVVDTSAVELATQADAVILAVGFNSDSEGEGLDREFALPPGQEALIKAIAAANKRTIVVLNSGGGVDVAGWIERVPALLAAWYPGQEGGTALAQLIFGDSSPSGRLPFSWERRLQDNPSYENFYPNDAKNPDRIVYREGVFVGYRGMQNAGTAPAFPFGSGLSYSTFSYGNVQVRPQPQVGRAAQNVPLFELTFDVTNTGKRPAATVAQLYVAPKRPRVPRPPRELKGFARVEVAPGETKPVSLTLDARAFTYFAVDRHGWRADAGEYMVEIGDSVQDIRVRIPLQLDPTIFIPVSGR